MSKAEEPCAAQAAPPVSAAEAAEAAAAPPPPPAATTSSPPPAAAALLAGALAAVAPPAAELERLAIAQQAALLRLRAGRAALAAVAGEAGSGAGGGGSAEAAAARLSRLEADAREAEALLQALSRDLAAAHRALGQVRGLLAAKRPELLARWRRRTRELLAEQGEEDVEEGGG
jgi:hypothetical protein